MPAPVNRPTSYVDDDGSGNVGSFWDTTTLTEQYDAIDAALTGVLEDASTGTQNNFALGVAGAAVFRWNGVSAVSFTGWLNGVSGRSVIFNNISSQIATFKHQNVSSTAANRFITASGADLDVPAGSFAIVWYDDTTDRWRVTLVLSSATAPTGMVQALNRNVTPASNGTTVETTLMTYTLPAAKLGTNGDTVRIKAYGSHAANGNTKTLRLYFGATVIAIYAAAPNGLGWIVEAEVSRTGATAQVAFGSVENGTSGKIMTNSTPAETLSGTIVIKITGQSATASNDITANGFSVEFVPNA